MRIPKNPKIYHIVHYDRLPSIINTGGLVSNALEQKYGLTGTTIGLSSLKGRRLTELELDSYEGLFVGQCVPFYFCSRSIMLYMIHKANYEALSYRGGQRPIVHLVADMRRVAAWVEQQGKRWVFTLSNAASRTFEDRASFDNLHELDWNAIKATNWSACKDEKQAEFLVEDRFPWELVERIGVIDKAHYSLVREIVQQATHQPQVAPEPTWYY